jgi:shikimate kinase
MNKHLVLVGMMGSGKTTVGRWIEAKRRLPFHDTDALVEKRDGRSIREIFRFSGETRFRELEQEVAAEVAAGPVGVVATGGGLFIDAANRALLLDKGIVFYLRADAGELAARLAGSANRPLFKQAGKETPPDFAALLATREPFYSLAHHTIDVGGRKVKEIGEEILRLYDDANHEDLS